MQAADTAKASPGGVEPPCSLGATANHDLKQYSLALARKRPYTSPIHRLPAEILSMIFEWLARMGGIYGIPPQSIQIMRVCKQWTALATNTPSLWQEIDGCMKADWFVTAAARSKNLPFNVSIAWCSQNVPTIVPPLLEEAHRIRSLDILYGEDLDATDLLISTILGVDRLPRLESIQITMCSAADQYELPYFDDGDRFPSLRTLELTSVGIPLGSSVFRQLRVLKLQGTWFPDWDEVPVYVLLDMLEACENLEELSLNFDIVVRFASYEPGDPPEAAVPLPLLRSFRLEWPMRWTPSTPSAVYQILEHLHLSPLADISLRLGVALTATGAISGAGIGGGPMDYLHAVPQDPACLHMLTTAASATLHGEGFSCRGRSGQGSLEVLLSGYRIPIAGALTAPFAYTQVAQLNDFCTIFARAPLTSLTLELVGLDYGSLVRAFSAFPHLATLDVRGDGLDPDARGLMPGTTLLLALLSSPTRSALASLDARNTGVVVPALRTLRIRQAPWAGHALRLVLSCLVGRAQRGAAPLSALRVGLLGEPCGSEAGERDDAALAALQAIVAGPVEYVVDEARDVQVW